MVLFLCESIRASLLNDIVVSCAGRFHSYDLAGQLEKDKRLNRIITTYPKSELRRFGIPSSKVNSLLYWELLNRGWGKLADYLGISRSYLQFVLAESYDLVAPSMIPEGVKIYIGWSSNSERGLLRARDLGAITILERGSAHIEVQTEILNEEYAQHFSGPMQRFTHPAIIEKELREYELADFISVPSSFVKQSFVQMGVPESKLIQNIYGVNLERFKPGTLQKGDKFTVIFVGQLSLQKGTHYLLRAFYELNLPHTRLILVGGKNPDIDPYLKKYSSVVEYVGSVAQNELPSYYSKAHVFCLPSLQEGFAMVQLQAMACGLPVICTTNTGGDDVIENGRSGFVIPIRSVEAIKERIEWLYLNREACFEMGLQARKKVIGGFSWDDYGSRYINNLKMCEYNLKLKSMNKEL